MDDLIDLYRQTKAAQKRAEQAGFPSTAAALARIADTMAQEANMDRGMVVPFAPRAAVPSTSALPIGHQLGAEAPALVVFRDHEAPATHRTASSASRPPTRR